MTEMDDRLEQRKNNFRHPSCGKIVLVGDRPGPGTNPAALEVVPFCATVNCSGWLNNLLPVGEDQLQWLNAHDLFGVETNIKELNRRLPARVVIALGNNASAWLKKHKIEHVKTYHPQYWKRFKHKHEYPLIRLIERYAS